MPSTIDRFVLKKDALNRVVKGWRLTRYSFGSATIQNLRSGWSFTGVIDDFGNIVWPPDNHNWRMETEELVPFYK